MGKYQTERRLKLNLSSTLHNFKTFETRSKGSVNLPQGSVNLVVLCFFFLILNFFENFEFFENLKFFENFKFFFFANFLKKFFFENFLKFFF